MRCTPPSAILAACVLACVASCSRVPPVAGETVLLDERVTLTRGETHDLARRELVAPTDGTCVAVVEEDDTDVKLSIQVTTANGKAASKLQVDSLAAGDGIEVAALGVARGSSVAVSLEGLPLMLTPGSARMRIACYGRDRRAPEVRTRIAAYEAWTEATRSGATPIAEAKKRLELMDRAIEGFDSPEGDPRMAAWARLTRSLIAYYVAVDWPAALADARASERAFLALAVPDPRSVARARHHAAAAMIELVNDGTAKNPTAAEAAVEARRLLEEVSSESSPLSAVEKARAVNNIGYLCYEIDDFVCADRYFAAAADAARKLGHRGDEIKALQNLGVVANERGDYARAARYYDQVLPFMERQAAPRDRIRTLNNAANAQSNLGNTARAIELLLTAQEIAREPGSVLTRGRVAHGLGLAYWRRGDMQQAEAFFAEALQARRIASDAIGLLASLRVNGMFARERGRIDDAIALHREALDRSVQGDMQLRAQLELARDHAAAGDLEQAITLCRKALAGPKTEYVTKRAEAELTLAEYLIERRNTPATLAEAMALTQAALKVAVQKSNSILEVNARHVLARLLAARGDLAAARREFEAAIALVLDFRGTTASPELQAATLAHEQGTFRDYVDLLMRDAVARGAGRFAPATRAEEDALRVLELARTSSSELVRDARVDVATQARIDELLQQMAGKRVRIAAVNDRSALPGKELQQLQLDMAHLRAEIDRLRGGRTDASRLTKLPESVYRPWPALPPGVTQLSYALGERNAYLWVRDARGLRVAVLAESPQRIERELAVLDAIDHVRTPEKMKLSLATLGATLLLPGTLDAASTTVEIVAEGSLGSLPFAALSQPGAPARRLIETHSVRMIASMFSVAAQPLARERALAFVGITSGTGSKRSMVRVFPVLGAARAEARAIAGLFDVAGATRIKLLTAAEGDPATVKALWSGGADVVHFATHALADVRHPAASLLLLPAGAGGEHAAYLTAGQVREWRGDAALVYLGACETAAGPGRFAEGMSGLPRSFLQAGARGVIATLWPVEDVLESEFSVDFYRHFIASRSAGDALAETQRAWLRPRPGVKASDQQRRLSTAWAHVFYALPQGGQADKVVAGNVTR